MPYPLSLQQVPALVPPDDLQARANGEPHQGHEGVDESNVIDVVGARTAHQVARLDGRDLTHRMNVTDIWTRRDARWQIIRRHATVAAG